MNNSPMTFCNITHGLLETRYIHLKVRGPLFLGYTVVLYIRSITGRKFLLK